MKRDVVLLLAVAAVIAAAASIWVLTRADTVLTVDISDAPVGDATVFVAGNTLGGRTCRTAQGAATTFDNLLPGKSELAALSTFHSVTFRSDVEWQVNGGEVVPITLDPISTLHVKIWNLTALSSEVDNALIEAHVKFARTQLALTKSGLALTADTEDHRTGVAQERFDCSNRDTIRANNWFDPRYTNVYYADSCGAGCTASGWSCEGEPQWNFVYSRGDKTALLHELGHALLAMKHTDHWQETFDATNVMRDSGDRTTFSIGQVIAMNYSLGGLLDKLGVRSPTSDCVGCPPMTFDASWPNCEPPATTFHPPEAIEALFDCIECTSGQLEKVVDNARKQPSVLATLLLQLRRIDVNDQSLRGVDLADRGNVVARRQQRALSALEVLALERHPLAREAIRAAANAAPSTFRHDTLRRIQAAAQMLQK